jgi:KUP system potassium uptake protein
MAAAGMVESGQPVPYGDLDLAALEIERDDLVVWSDGDEGYVPFSIPSTSAFTASVYVPRLFLARGRREQKVRFVAEPHGIVRKLVPRDHIEAQRSPDWPHYWEAMLKEMDSQTECRTFQYVDSDHPSLQGVTPIPLGWVYDCKVNTLTNELIKYKARLIARGNHANEAEHYFDRYAGVVRMSTVRLLFAMSAQHGWELTSGDIPTAYLQSWIHDVPLYCELPPMFPQVGNKIARIFRSLYGLPQSAYEWGDELRLAMLSFGFVRCHADRQLYLWVVPGRGIVAVCLWVDDAIVATSSSAMRAEYVAFMVERFKFTDLGPLTRALGCDVRQDLSAGIVEFSLTGYIRDAARRLEIRERAYDTPATAAVIRACDAAKPPSEGPERDQLIRVYSVIVGVESFIASTARPDIAWVTHYLSRHLQLPTQKHMDLAIRVMQYLQCTAALAITYAKSDSFFAGGVFHPGEDPETSAAPHLVADSNLNTPRSTSGWAFVVARAAVVWKVLAQIDPALSSGEAEFYALVTAIAAGVHLRQLMAELTHTWVGPMQVFSDSRVARLMVHNGKAETNVRHVDLKWWFANHHVEQGHVHVAAVNGSSNPSNGLTKVTSGSTFLAERAYLMGLDSPGTTSTRPTSVAAMVSLFRGIGTGIDVSAAFVQSEISE